MGNTGQLEATPTNTARSALRFRIIHAFMADRHSPSLFAFLHLSPSAAQATLEAGLKRTMMWARHHQRNKEYHREANWLIFNELLIRSAILERPEEYLAEVRLINSLKEHVPPAFSAPSLEVPPPPPGAPAEDLGDDYLTAGLLDAFDSPQADDIQPVTDDFDDMPTDRFAAMSENTGLPEYESYEEDAPTDEQLPSEETLLSVEVGEPEASEHTGLSGLDFSGLDFSEPERHEPEAPATEAPAVVAMEKPAGKPAGKPAEKTAVTERTEKNDAQEWATAPPSIIDEPAPDEGAPEEARSRPSAGNDAVKAALPLLMMTALLGLVMLLAIPIVASALQPPEAPRTMMTVRASPEVGTITINNIPRAINGTASFEGTLPEGVPLSVRIEASGFETWEQSVTLTAGSPVMLSPELTLADGMRFQPVSAFQRGELPSDFVDQIKKRQRFFDACFAKLAIPEGELVARINGYTTSMGVVGRIEISGVPTSPAFEQCMQRQFRAIQLPLDPTHDYAVFEHTFIHTIARKR